MGEGKLIHIQRKYHWEIQLKEKGFQPAPTDNWYSHVKQNFNSKIYVNMEHLHKTY